MQEFHANQTVWEISLTQSFNDGENITKQLFCFQLACKVRPKSQTRAKVALFCQQPHPKSQQVGIWRHCIPGNMSFLWAGKTYLQPISCLFISLWLGFNNTLNVFQSLPSLIEIYIFESWSLLSQGSFALCPLVHELQTASSWNLHLVEVCTFTVPINSSLDMARFKPSQPFMMSSGTSKWTKTQL